MRVDDARRGDQALAGEDSGVRVDDEVNPRLDVGVAGPPSAGDPAVGDSDRGLANAKQRIEDEDVGDDHVEGAVAARARPSRRGGGHQDAVPRGLAAAAQQFVPGINVVGLDLDPQAGVGQP